jgi:Zn-dependent oligopeptidase
MILRRYNIMTKAKLQEIMKQYCIIECELDDVIRFVNEVLYERRRELEQNEPYATNTIKKLHDAEMEVWDLQYYIDEIKEEENNEVQ